ncbi:unnamed protein product [Adineta steineri]|uniref:Translation elongation factor EFTu/EF1A C-terminal domain-containing protein n=1 Tax=Adineta steineri TaxID=433720 RepID=A0A814WHA3_9BILA|nr:unnamed protein product [Adineta steineri]CAF1204034.1 unnamed protein product [Adineta steineri]CAF3703116.1 unnamed protein product [Adineta steineri]CAF3981118.1 unnamed protein product [Adineta steineri]
MYILREEEDNRQTVFSTGHQAQVYLRTAEVTGTIELPDDVEEFYPGDRLTVVITFTTPIAINNGVHFSIREQRRLIGVGVVAGVME